jgi:multidrug efflux pump subunit AcrA (membrane-fusion protein)
LAEVVDGHDLIQGMSVNVMLARATRETISLPRIVFAANAEMRPGADSAVFVLEGDRVRRRTVSVQAIEDGLVTVGKGLTPGDRVIVAPSAELKEGALARVK